jgi:hypothetical protein
VKESAASSFRLLPELFDVYAGGDAPTVQYDSRISESMYSAVPLFYAATVSGASALCLHQQGFALHCHVSMLHV